MTTVLIDNVPNKIGPCPIRLPNGSRAIAQIVINKGRRLGVFPSGEKLPRGTLWEIAYDETKSEDYFTSDTHLGHRAIIKYRAIETLEAMDEQILREINARVRPQDRLTILGDFCLGGWKKAAAYRKQINCKTVNLIMGNHDDDAILKRAKDAGFNWVEKARTVVIHGQAIELYHYAQRVWDRAHYGAWHLYGHSHGSLPETGGKCFDCGWDATRILSFAQVCAEMEKRELTVADRHRPA